jgi:uncharacterized protein YndB with AHSA1/START domain
VRGVYREIVVPERIVWTARLEEDGAPEAELLMTVAFVEQGWQDSAHCRSSSIQNGS